MQEIAAEYFEGVTERRATESLKWNTYDPDVLPMWVADMDFRAPPEVIQALRQRIDHGIFGYAANPGFLVDLILERLQRLYRWTVPAEAICFVPGVVPGFNIAVRALARPGGEVLIQTPVYPPFLKAAGHSGMGTSTEELVCGAGDRYEIDFSSFEESISGETCAFLLCNPHNPVGRVFGTDELSRMAQACLRHSVNIIADEIHCDLVYPGYNHYPIASLDPEVARRTITLMAPSKTYNIPGLDCAFAIIPDQVLRQKFDAARAGLVPGVNLLAIIAAAAAYRDGDPWLKGLLSYLTSNRDFVLGFVEKHLPGISTFKPEGTFLSWLDCRSADLPSKPAKFFLDHGRVALSDGKNFGPGGDGFIRLNFGCPRPLLEEGLRRMATALSARKTGWDRRTQRETL